MEFLFLDMFLKNTLVLLSKLTNNNLKKTIVGIIIDEE